MLPFVESITIELIKSVGKSVIGEKDPDIWQRVYGAADRAVDRFYSKYADGFGTRGESFLAYQVTWDRITRSFFISAEPLSVEGLRGSSDAPWPPVTDEALLDFIGFIDDEIKNDWALDKVLSTKTMAAMVAEIHNSVVRTPTGGPSVPISLTSSPHPADTNDRYGSLLDRTKALLGAHKPATALEILQGLEAELIDKVVDPAIRGRLQNHLGSAHLQLGNHAEAVKHFARVLDYQPDDPAALRNFAAGRLLNGEAEAALELVENILHKNPEDETAWQIKVQAIHTLGQPTIQPPDSVLHSPAFLSASAHIALQGHNWSLAASLAEDALARGTRDHATLLQVAQAHSNSIMDRRHQPAGPNVDKARRVMEHVERLVAEALLLLEATELVDEKAMALTLRAATHRFFGRRQDAQRDLTQATTLAPNSWQPRFHLVALLLDDEKASEALFVLEGAASLDSDATLLSLKGTALVALHRPTEAEGTFRDALRLALGTDDEMDVRLAGAEQLAEAGLLETADAFVQVVPDNSREWEAQVLRGRIASAQGNSVGSDVFYETAVASAPADERRRQIQLEFAYSLGRRGDLKRAVEMFEEARAMQAPEEIRRVFLRTLFTSGAYPRLDELLAGMTKEGTLPSWAEELAGLLAHARDDTEREIAHLERYLAARPEDVERGIQLAHAYQRTRKHNEMALLLGRLRGTEGLRAYQMTRLAILSSAVGATTEAIDIGYRGLRKDPNNYHVQRGFVALIVGLRNEAKLPTPAAVAGDTVVVIEGEDGRVVEYVILSEAPVDAGRGEALSTDASVADLIGQPVGASVVRHAGTLAEMSYKVREILPAPIHAFRQILANHQKQFPESTAFHMFKISDDPTIRDFAPIIQGVESRADQAETAFGLHEERLMPLGALADALGSDIPTLVRTMTSMSGRRLMSEFGNDADREAAVAAAMKTAQDGAPLTLTSSGLITAQSLGLLELCRDMFAARIIPRALLDNFYKEREEWARGSVEGMKSIVRSPFGSIQFVEFSPESVRSILEKTESLIGWIENSCDVVPLPLSAPSKAAEQRRETLGAESFGVLEIAGSAQGVFYADDLGLRGLAHTENGPQGFSTYAFVEAARRLERISDAERSSYLQALVLAQHYFIPMSAGFLNDVLRLNGYQLNGNVYRSLERLAGPDVDAASAISVAAGLVRALALSTLGRGSVTTATLGCAEVLTIGRPPAQTIREFRAALHQALGLMPTVVMETDAALARFVAGKA